MYFLKKTENHNAKQSRRNTQTADTLISSKIDMITVNSQKSKH